ncbi:MAG: exo-alpha-sialidase [Bryobacterales bacterium]|nr:exo-alpha-sialidase [Bryobacterales bacterium]
MTASRRTILRTALGGALAARLPAAPRLEIGEPRLIAEGPAEEKRWGYYQFPNLDFLPDGRIVAGFHVLADAAESYGSRPAAPDRAVSADKGESWKLDASLESGCGLLLPNGDRLRIVTPKPFPLAPLRVPKPAAEKRGTYSGEHYTLYRLRELPEPLGRVWLSRRRKGARAFVEEQSGLDDPLALRYSLRGMFPIVWWGDLRVAPGGSLLAGTYPGYLEGQAGLPCNVFFYRSQDLGRNWRVQGRILYQPDLHADPQGASRDGFTEPAFEILRDGSLLCVLRTTDGRGTGPMYLSRSRDLGKTWSKPAAFAPTGVLPRLLLLGNGVLVLSSGRPGVDLRVSYDGRGERWTGPVPLVPVTGNAQADSCGYTSLLPLDDNRFLVAYSWFRRPDSDGKEHKSILVRRVEVRP